MVNEKIKKKKTGKKSSCKIHENLGIERVQLKKIKSTLKIHNVNPLIIIIIDGG